MPCAPAVGHAPGPRIGGGRGSRRALVLALAGVWVSAALAQGVGPGPGPAGPAVEVVELAATRHADAVLLDYQLRVTLPAVVEEAVRRGVPLYFIARATLWRSRWYWRDARVSTAQREWRLTFQPLTSTWRVSQGGLGQSRDSLGEALAIMARSSGWPIAEAGQAEADGRHYVEFEWMLDTTQLPRPLQIGVTGAGGGGDWALGVERSVKVSAAPAPGPEGGLAK